MTEILQSFGADVVPAASSQEALDRLSQSTPDIVLSDIGMRGEDGYTFIRRFRQQAPGAQIPAIALTGLGTAQHQRDALEAGFSASLLKPLQPDLLVE
ncbi:MAG: response regulator, partial [Candidatus Binataceae bacterium]